MVDLQEIEAIKRLKYRYLRCVDLKRWKELEGCFTEDATAAYSDGKYSYTGREKIMEFLIGAMSPDNMTTSHTVHHPEIDLTSPTTATVRRPCAAEVIRRALFSFSLFENVKPQRQWRAEPCGMRGVIGQVVTGLGMHQHRKAVAIEHQPWHESAE